MEQHSSFGLWLKDLRKARGLTQRQLAEMIGYSAVAILKIERGERRPSLYIAERMSEVLQIAAEQHDTFVRFARGDLGRPDPELPSSDAATPTAEIPNNLMLPSTSLVDRSTEIATLTTLLRTSRARLVTITGSPGIGKSRLAREVGVALLPDFKDGVFCISLAQTSSAEELLPTIAHELRVEDAGKEVLRAGLLDYLHNKQLLLILDNFEHLLAATNQVSELLSFCPRLKVLIASRASLRLQAEHEMRLQPLPVPPDAAASRAELAQYGAVALFVERVNSFKPDFELTDGNAALVRDICTRLDGLPLAIELAAARLRYFSLPELRRRLGSRLKLLVNGPSDLDPRHQRIRSAIQWSYDLLEPQERDIFCRVAVFAAWFTLGDAETVCAPAVNDEDETLELLVGLVDKSLLLPQETGDVPRFSLLEIVREFALEQLAAGTAEDEVRARHAAYFLDRAERNSGGDDASLKRQREAMEDLRLALAWYEQQEDWLALARLLGAMTTLWYNDGYYESAQRLLALVLAHGSALPRNAVLANILLGAGMLASVDGDLAAAAAFYDRSIALGRETGSRELLAAALLQRDLLAAALGEAPVALTAADDAALDADSNDNSIRVAALSATGHELQRHGESAAASQALQSALLLLQQPQAKRTDGWLMESLGSLARVLGEPPMAERIYRSALEQMRRQDDHFGMGTILLHLGELAHAEGDIGHAAAHYRDALYLWRELGVSIRLLRLVFSMVELASAANLIEQAVYLLVSGAALADVTERATNADQNEWARWRSTLEQQIGPKQYADLAAQAQRMSLEQAADLLVSSAQLAQATAPPVSAAPDQAGHGGHEQDTAAQGSAEPPYPARARSAPDANSP